MSHHPHASERVRHAADRRQLIRSLRECLKHDAILWEREDVRPYECDGLTVYQTVPWLVVLPESVGQVQAVVRRCHKWGVPVVARGAGTGLSGGALPIENGVLLSLAKLNRILEIDTPNRCARVEPGVRNAAVSEAARRHNLYYAPDPSSQIACSIGGNVAENSGGVHCLKYGLTVHNVLGLKLVTIDGELIEIGGAALDQGGYDLLALVTGSEGLLGIVVEVTVKLLPIPESARVLLASFDSIEAAGDAVARIIGTGLLPAGLEMMDALAIRAAEDFVHAGYPIDVAAVLLCEFDGNAEQVKSDTGHAEAILRSCGAREVRVSQSNEERERFWTGRKAAFPAVGRMAADYYCMDGTIPRRHLGKVLTRIGELSDEYGLRVANVFHAGDGNLHPLILFDASHPGELAKAEAFGSRILELCIEVGGTITGEHGVGVEKINQMCVQFGAAELGQFHAVKRAFDPDGLLNPGKAIPSLHRCAEFGRMHVHRGRVRHPELERF